MIITALLQLITHGNALVRVSIGGWAYAYQAVLLATLVGYFYVGWTGKGQTLGMKAWNLRLERSDGHRVSLRDVLVRLAVSTPMYLWVIGSTLFYLRTHGHWLWLMMAALPLAGSFAWHALTGRGTLDDRLSGTRLVYLSPNER